MKNKLYRQGDVLLQHVKEISKGAEPEETKDRPTVAFGTATGHHHSFPIGSVKFHRDKKTGTLFIEVPAKGAVMEHQEHSPIPLPQGIYRHIQQRGYSPEAIRNVRD